MPKVVAAAHGVTSQVLQMVVIAITAIRFPSLYQYGKLRGDSEAVIKYTWGKIYNAKAYNACTNMPRFGSENILTEAQMKDLMALLLDPNSPVNKN